MSKNIRQWVAVGLLLTSMAAVSGTMPAWAQESGRRPKVKVDPAYPELAKRMRISGVVKVEVTITAGGAVKGTRVVGGNPVLVEAALDALKKWRFENAPDETTQVMEFRFNPL